MVESFGHDSDGATVNATDSGDDSVRSQIMRLVIGEQSVFYKLRVFIEQNP